MNPSANGWINKLLRDLKNNPSFGSLSKVEMYSALRSCGFIYGNNVCVAQQLFDNNDLSDEELCKVNLCIALYFNYNSTPTELTFADSVIEFYTKIEDYKTSFFNELLGEKKSSNVLENILHKRVLIDTNLITKSFNYFITNALLYVDVLAYKHFLKNNAITVDYIKNMESAIETIVLNVLDSKEVKSEYDLSLIKLFQQSLRYQNKVNLSYNEAIALLHTDFEALYMLDIAGLATWSDAVIDKKELLFLNTLSDALKIPETSVSESISEIKLFFDINKKQISLLNSKTIVKTFYDNSSRMVTKLISRNSKRLLKELIESKELMVLLSHSTVRDLSAEEQKKVQEQLLDIFKSIPSLAIFILPGGALLLPLVIKFIPKLLPSAFDDNRIEED